MHKVDLDCNGKTLITQIFVKLKEIGIYLSIPAQELETKSHIRAELQLIK